MRCLARARCLRLRFGGPIARLPPVRMGRAMPRAGIGCAGWSGLQRCWWPDSRWSRWEPLDDHHIPIDLSELRARRARDHADGCMHLLLRLRRLWRGAKAEDGGLLRVLLIRVGSLPSSTGRPIVLPRAGKPMSSDTDGTTGCADRARGTRGCRGAAAGRERMVDPVPGFRDRRREALLYAGMDSRPHTDLLEPTRHALAVGAIRTGFCQQRRDGAPTVCEPRAGERHPCAEAHQPAHRRP
jgi:hypothetical protein